MLSAVTFSWAETIGNLHTSLQGKITTKSGEPILGVTIYFPELKTGAVTDISGNYRIDNLPPKTLLVQISSLGYKMVAENIPLAQTSKKDYVLEETIIEINEIAVTGQASATQAVKTPTSISVITRNELQQQGTTNIIDAISSQPGISQITTGSGISKPVIRGLGYNRIVVMNDGIRQEGQQWGDEHGIEIDESEVDRVEILKGPASLMYGSDAIAGVINFLSSPILPEGKKTLNFLANYQTNNGLRAYSLNFAGHEKSFVWDVRYSNKAAHAYKNKYDGYVYNSGFSENAVSALLGINKWWGYSHLTLSAYQLTPGIVEGDRDSATGQFIKPVAIDNETEAEAIATDKDFLIYKHQMPYQQVKHYKAALNNNILLGNGFLKTTIGFQQNHRQEFEDVLNPENYALYFKLNTINYDVHYLVPENKGWGISFGVNGMYQNSRNLGEEFLIPEFRLFDIGTFIMIKKTWDKLDISGGLRYDNRSETADALYLGENGEVTGAVSPDATQKFAAFNGNFDGVSGSLGASYRFSDHWNMKLNLSRAFRAPNISELGSNGVHEGTIRYEIGNQRLKAETSLQLDYELGFNSRHVSTKVNLFSNLIDNYIYSHKLSSVLGGDSIAEDMACFKFESGKARVSGGEFILDIHPHPLDWLHFQNSFSYVNAQLLNQPDSTRYLPFTPAPRWNSELRAEIETRGNLLKNTYISLGIEHYFRQNNVYSAYATETTTPAYSLVNAAFGTDLLINKQKITVYINAANLTDMAYQSHLSRLKYASVNNATGRTGVYNMGRNISLKLIVPVNL